jgi:hypothetical protein
VTVILAIPGHKSPGASPPGAGSRRTGGGTSAIGATAPGTPAVVIASQGQNDVRFDWTYLNHSRGDVFRWHRIGTGSGPASGSTTKPTLLLAVSKGKSVCITVQVVRADGSQASQVSQPQCGS